MEPQQHPDAERLTFLIDNARVRFVDLKAYLNSAVGLNVPVQLPVGWATAMIKRAVWIMHGHDFHRSAVYIDVIISDHTGAGLRKVPTTFVYTYTGRSRDTLLYNHIGEADWSQNPKLVNYGNPQLRFGDVKFAIDASKCNRSALRHLQRMKLMEEDHRNNNDDPEGKEVEMDDDGEGGLGNSDHDDDDDDDGMQESKAEESDGSSSDDDIYGQSASKKQRSYYNIKPISARRLVYEAPPPPARSTRTFNLGDLPRIQRSQAELDYQQDLKERRKARRARYPEAKPKPEKRKRRPV